MCYKPLGQFFCGIFFARSFGGRRAGSPGVTAGNIRTSSTSTSRLALGKKPTTSVGFANFTAPYIPDAPRRGRHDPFQRRRYKQRRERRHRVPAQGRRGRWIPCLREGPSPGARYEICGEGVPAPSDRRRGAFRRLRVPRRLLLVRKLMAPPTYKRLAMYVERNLTRKTENVTRRRPAAAPGSAPRRARATPAQSRAPASNRRARSSSVFVEPP